MSLRSGWLVGLSALALSSTAALADLVTVTSYDMNNGNGATQFTFGPNYFDFSYTGANANQNGSNQPIPNNAAPKDAPLSGGTGLLTDGVIATQVYSTVTSATATIASGAYAGQPTQYVGWKYQDPTITFHLAAGQDVSSISIYVAANNPAIGNLNGLVAAPAAAQLTIDGVPIASSFLLSVINPNTGLITLSGFGSIASTSTFELTLLRGPLQQDGINYYNDHVRGFNPADPTNISNCVDFCDPDPMPGNEAFASGFRAEAAGGNVGPLTNAGLEPWIMVSEVQFFTAAVPEPSTWMMMIAGFAGLAFVARRRKMKPVAEFA